jgi:hypothetical protein
MNDTRRDGRSFESLVLLVVAAMTDPLLLVRMLIRLCSRTKEEPKP